MPFGGSAHVGRDRWLHRSDGRIPKAEGPASFWVRKPPGRRGCFRAARSKSCTTSLQNPIILQATQVLCLKLQRYCVCALVLARTIKNPKISVISVPFSFTVHPTPFPVSHSIPHVCLFAWWNSWPKPMWWHALGSHATTKSPHTMSVMSYLKPCPAMEFCNLTCDPPLSKSGF